jgi:hypothetical protein
MKEFLSLFLFGIGALCFVVFFATLKPTVVTAAVGPREPGHCSTKGSSALECRPDVFAGVSWPRVGQRW